MIFICLGSSKQKLETKRNRNNHLLWVFLTCFFNFICFAYLGRDGVALVDENCLLVRNYETKIKKKMMIKERFTFKFQHLCFGFC